MEKRTYNYEGMFLIGQAQAVNFGEVIAHIRHTIERYGGSIIAMRKWDERRLAYEIDKQKRGLYILAYFSAPNAEMGQIERAFNLSEQVLRMLITRADHMTLEEMQAADDAKGLETEAKMRATQPVMAVPQEAPAPVGGPDASDEE